MSRLRQSHPPPSSPNRALRLCYAGIALCVVRWVLSPAVPALGPDFYVEKLLGPILGSPSIWVDWVVGVAIAASYALLGWVVYCYPRWKHALWKIEPLGDATLPAPPRRFTTALVCIAVVALLALAYHNRLLVDDAFIAFRYAGNFARGLGLVYNPGDRVEGYTNFLWVMLMAAGMRIGLDPGPWSQCLGLACYAGTLLLTYRIARLVLPGAAWAIATVLLVGTNYTVLSFATGGLETSLQTFLLMAGCTVLISAHRRRAWSHRNILALSFILSAGILTRMDFVVFGAVLVPGAMVSVFVTQRGGTRRDSRSSELFATRVQQMGPMTHPTALVTQPGAPRRVLGRQAAMLLCPILFIVATWLTWKAWYYGSVLPNTYFAKRPTLNGLWVGAEYLWAFCSQYRLVLPILVAAIGGVQLFRERHVLLSGALIIVAWAAYLVAVGGDFMEFRFLMPILPLLLLCLVWTTTRFSILRRRYLHVLLLAWVAYGSLHHAQTYVWDILNPVPAPNPEPVYHMRRLLEEGHWVEAGQALGNYFAGDDIVLATTASGALPYYSGLRTLDMHGLCDKHVARFGTVIGDRPGHHRMATFHDLQRYGAHLVVGNPWILSDDVLDDQPPGALALFAQPRPPGRVATIVAIPITPREVLMAWYLTPHWAIDRQIASNDWRTFHLPAEEEGRH